MAYKSLLTIATSPEGLLTTVTAAAEIALKMDAHLDGLALGVDRTQIGYSYVGSGAVVIAAAMDRRRGRGARSRRQPADRSHRGAGCRRFAHP